MLQWVSKLKSQQAAKGAVSIAPYKMGLCLRWRYNDIRPALYISSSTISYQKIAHVVKGIIERDLLICDYNERLQRHHELIQKAVLHDATLKHKILTAIYAAAKDSVTKKSKPPLEIIPTFNEYLGAKGKSEHGHSCYYYDTRQMLKRWAHLSWTICRITECRAGSNKTFNDRSNCLNRFFNGVSASIR